jgi:folate-dependent phosphoribosylglycinamide formyltransferase PurN
MLRIGWFSTGRGEGSQKLLRATVEAIRDGRLNAELACVFSNREPGQSDATDAFFRQVESYGVPLVTLSDARFRREQGGPVARAGQPLPPWRAAYDERVHDLLSRYEFDLGMLAGYMLIATAPLFERHHLLNLHPAAPDGPAGTWQQVTWRLIADNAHHSGVRVHLVTEGLDDGPIVTYCQYPLRGPAIDILWHAASDRAVEEIQTSDGESSPLFGEIRRRGAAREIPLVVETLRAFADGRLRLDGDRIMAGDTRVVGGYDLTPEIERALATPATA